MPDHLDTQAFIERLAREGGAKLKTVQQWRCRGKVPHRWRLELMAAAADSGRKLLPTDFEGLSVNRPHR